jgi:DNA-binding MarR family transcriptional regulator
MNANYLDELKFLLKLQECRNYRAYLTNTCFKSFRAKNKICQSLAEDGLVDLTREIVAVKLSPAGQALLKVSDDALPISETEFRLLKRIAAAQKITLTQLRTTALSAAERDAILQTFLNRGLITAETRMKRQKAEVWLTPQGQACLAELLNQFHTLRQSATPITPNPKPTDAEILKTIQILDHEIGSNNYLPIFHLRQKFQPPLSRDELDEILYRLQREDKIELRAIVHTQDYSVDQLSAAIQTRSGSPLFFIKVI